MGPPTGYDDVGDHRPPSKSVGQGRGVIVPELDCDCLAVLLGLNSTFGPATEDWGKRSYPYLSDLSALTLVPIKG